MANADTIPAFHKDLAETVARELFAAMVARGVLNDPFCPDPESLLNSLTYWVSFRQQEEGVRSGRYDLLSLETGENDEGR
jgi:hypothetical protein